MAVVTPVFERKLNTHKTEDERRNERMSAEDVHNSRISDNFARLVNPENKLKDIMASIDVEGSHVLQSPVEEYEPEMPTVMRAAQPRATSNPSPALFVRNARADADIFRADSPVNSRAMFAQSRPAYADYENESEDLRPTETTIQYKTIGENGAAMPYDSARIITESEFGRSREQARKESKFVLKKRDKIMLGVVVALILTVFALIIVNSAVISNLNSEISSLEARYEEAMDGYAQVAAEYAEVTSPEYVLEAYNTMLGQ